MTNTEVSNTEFIGHLAGWTLVTESKQEDLAFFLLGLAVGANDSW